ncbi:MAG: AraC family transcriptional regulator, partial [bacterium]|nr:AraC family transcriptional regulator [bacterium]
MDRSELRHVVIVLFEDAKLLDVAGPMQVFNDARDDEGQRAYRVTLASAGGGPIVTDTGAALATERLDDIETAAIDTLLIAGGATALATAKSVPLRTWLKANAEIPRRLGSICYGAFILAELGFLDGRPATTHWAVCDFLASEYPAVSVTADAIYVVADRIWTSAGVTAGIDMAVAMVEQDLGHSAALALARDLVLFLKRPGGQSQFSVELRRQTRDARGWFDDLHDWIRANLTRDLSVLALA